MTSMNFLLSIPYRLNRKTFLIRLIIMLPRDTAFLHDTLYTLCFFDTGYFNSYSLKRSKELCDSDDIAGLRTDSSL